MLFQGLNGQLDTKSRHAACVVLSGIKWSAVKWMRERARARAKFRL